MKLRCFVIGWLIGRVLSEALAWAGAQREKRSQCTSADLETWKQDPGYQESVIARIAESKKPADPREEAIQAFPFLKGALERINMNLRTFLENGVPSNAAATLQHDENTIQNIKKRWNEIHRHAPASLSLEISRTERALKKLKRYVFGSVTKPAGAKEH